MKNNLKKIISIITASVFLTAEFLILAFIVFSIVFLYDDERSEVRVLMIISLVLFTILMVLSVVGIVLIARNKKYVISTLILSKISLWLLAFSALYIIAFEEYGVAILFGILTLIPSGSAVIIYAVRNINPKNEAQPIYNENFGADKAKWYWDEAADEYCRLHEKSIEDLTDEEQALIYEYAGGHIAYMLAWLIRQGFMSEKFMVSTKKSDIDNILNERISPVEFLRDNMDYILDAGSVSDNIVDFLNKYYKNSNGYSLVSRRTGKSYNYMYDYKKTVEKFSVVYCNAFSWEKYHELEQLINRRYRYYLCVVNYLYDMENSKAVSHGKTEWKLFGVYLNVLSDKNVSESYVKKCIDNLEFMSYSMIDDMCKGLIEDVFGGDALLKDILWDDDNRRIINNEYVFPDSMEIYTPVDESIPAYVISGKSVFEEEHGFSIIIKGDKIIECCQRPDSYNPWVEDFEDFAV